MKVKSHSNSKVKKVAIVFSILILFILVAVGVFYTAYNYGVGSSYSEYENKAKSYLADIKKLNNSTSTLIKDNKIDTKNATTALNKIIDGLKKDATSIQDLIATDTQSKDKQTLLSGLNSNITIYQQIVAMLVATDTTNAAQALTDLKQSRDDCLQAYTLLGITDTDKSTAFINSAISYLYDQNKVQQTQSIVKSQTDDYITSIDVTVKQYLNLKTNYNQLLQDVRNNKGSYDDILNAVSKNTTSLQTVFQNFTNLKNMPANYKDSYTTLNKVLDDYTAYLQNLKFIIANEKAQAANAPISPDAAIQLYSSANAQLTTVENDYSDFTIKYSIFKSSVSK